MTLVVDKFRQLIPARSKSSPSGWTSFNAPCCHHRGHKPDTRKRAGVRFDGDGIIYNCFNCKFTTGWQPGSPFGEKIKTLCVWLGANDNDINEMIFESLKTESTNIVDTTVKPVDFEEKHLPEGAMSVADWLSSPYAEEVVALISPVIDYVSDRGFDPLCDDFYWSPSAGYENRVIIPFRYQGRIVGNTARKVTEGRPKYLSDQPSRFVFNMDRQEPEQRYVFVVEGPFDALAIGGLALLNNEISDQQAQIIESLGCEVIVIPDQDRAGLLTIKQAMERGWSVAFPSWEDGVKDVAEAVQAYGQLFVAVDAIKTSQKGSIKITMHLKQLESKISRIENNENTD